MTASVSLDRPATGGFKVDISRGHNIGRVSSEWFNRPDDERFLSLETLYDRVRARADIASTRIVESRAIRVQAQSDNPERLALVSSGSSAPIAPTCLTTWVPEKGMSDFDNLSQRRLLLSSFHRCYAVGVQRRRQTGESQLVLQTGNPMQPFRTTSRAPKRDERIVALIA